MKISSTSGGMARKKSIQAIAVQRTARERDSETEREGRPPASPSGMTMRQMRIVCLRPAQQSGNAFSMMRKVEELLTDRVHQALRQANRVSRKRPSTTTGMNRIT